MIPRVFWAGCWLLGVAVLAVIVLRVPAGDDLVVTRYAGYLLPWLLAGLLPGLLAACAARRWALAAVFGVSTAVILATYSPLLLPRTARPHPAAGRLDVMSYNTWTENHDAGRVARVVMEQKPDVLLLQEVEPDFFARLLARLHNLYGGAALYRAYEPRIQQALISRFPIESDASLSHHGEVQRVVLRPPLGPVTVFNVHLQRGDAWWRRYRQLEAILEEEVLPERGPVILGGDFNAPDQSQPYKLAARWLRNAHWDAGRGFGFTYPSPEAHPFDVVPLPPLVRIDHIFFSRHFVARRAGTISDSGGSDHLPVFAEIEVAPARLRSARSPTPTGP